MPCFFVAVAALVVFLAVVLAVVVFVVDIVDVTVVDIPRCRHSHM